MLFPVWFLPRQAIYTRISGNYWQRRRKQVCPGCLRSIITTLWRFIYWWNILLAVFTFFQRRKWRREEYVEPSEHISSPIWIELAVKTFLQHANKMIPKPRAPFAFDIYVLWDVKLLKAIRILYLQWKWLGTISAYFHLQKVRNVRKAYPLFKLLLKLKLNISYFMVF